MKLDLILFDLDGTLIDSCPDLAAAANHTLAQLGRRPISEAQVHNVLGEGTHALARFLGDSIAEIERAIAIFASYYAEHLLDRTRLYPGVRQLLADLDAPLAIVSNKPEILCREILAGVGIADRFEVVIGGDSCAAAKPSPVPLREALAQFQRSPWATRPRAVMIGDTPTDMLAATLAHVPSVGVTWGYSSARELEVTGAGTLVASPEALVRWFEGGDANSSPGPGGARLAPELASQQRAAV